MTQISGITPGSPAVLADIVATALMEVERTDQGSRQVAMSVLMQGLADNIALLMNPGRANETGISLTGRFARSVNVLAYGADYTGTNDSTAAFNAAFTAARALSTEERCEVIIPAGEYRLDGQVTITRETSMIGAGSVFTKLFCNFAGTAFVSPERQIDSVIKGVTFTHEDNTDVTATRNLLELEDGAIGCCWEDLVFEAGTATLSGFICHGENPNTLAANNRGYNNDMVRCKWRKATGFTGTAAGIGFHGRGTTQTNTGYNGNTFWQCRWALESFATHCRLDGANNLLHGCTMNPTLTAGLHIQRDRTNGGDANLYQGIFDAVWDDGPKVLLTNNIDSFELMLQLGNGILPDAVTRNGTFGTQAQFSIWGIQDYLLGGKNNRTLPALCPRIAHTATDGLIRINGTDDLDGGGIIAAGPDLSADINPVDIAGLGLHHPASSSIAIARATSASSFTRYAEFIEGALRLIAQGTLPTAAGGGALEDGSMFYANPTLGATLRGEGLYAIVNDITVPMARETAKSVNEQTGTSYELTLADADNIVMMDNAAANTVEIPNNSNTAIPVNTEIEIVQTGAGTTTIDALSGVQLNGTANGQADMNAQFARAKITKIANNVWILTGEVGAVA